jgi:hypothetical protein
MSWFGIYAAKGIRDLVQGELAPSSERGEPYLLPDERARQSACARLAGAGLDVSHVEVRVLSGVLQLTGRVPNEATRVRVGELCEGLTGVSRIENELAVT